MRIDIARPGGAQGPGSARPSDVGGCQRRPGRPVTHSARLAPVRNRNGPCIQACAAALTAPDAIGVWARIAGRRDAVASARGTNVPPDGKGRPITLTAPGTATCHLLRRA